MLPFADPRRDSALAALTEAIEERLAGGTRLHADRRSVGPFSPFLRHGAMHEWHVDDPDPARPQRDSRRSWRAPLTIMLDIARATLTAPDQDGAAAAESETSLGAGMCVWVGRRCWPNPVALAKQSPALLRKSLFVHPPGREERVWALDVALRNVGACVVIADGSALRFNDTRRLQLAAEAGGALGLLVRPGWEADEPSGAATRWRVTTAPSDDADPRWTVDLLRCKGLRPTPYEARRWSVRWSHATCDVRVAPHAPYRDRPASAPHHPRRAL